MFDRKDFFSEVYVNIWFQLYVGLKTSVVKVQPMLSIADGVIRFFY